MTTLNEVVKMPVTKRMTERAALSEARKRWGKNGCVSQRKEPSSAAQREAGHAELMRLRASRPQRPTTNDVPGGRTGPEWEAYRKAWREWKDQESAAFGEAMYHRYSVGEIVMDGMAFCVWGSGDTWEDAFANARQ